MSLYSDNFWAEEMGLDLSELVKERPSHPNQIYIKMKVTKQSEEYWKRERFLARLKNHIPKRLIDTVIEKHDPNKKKQVRVGRYDFTQRQIEIARQSLDGNDSV